MNRPKVLIDTSIWIEYFKGKDKVVKEIYALIDDDRVVTTGIIIAELIQGVKNTKEKDFIIKAISSITYIEITLYTWIEAGNRSYKLRKNGKTVPLSDVIIASLAIENEFQIFSLDNHFKMIDGVKIYPFGYSSI